MTKELPKKPKKRPSGANARFNVLDAFDNNYARVLSRQDIQDRLGVSAVKATLEALEAQLKAGTIIKIGNGGTTRYRLKPNRKLTHKADTNEIIIEQVSKSKS